jgi:RNA polymerase primary sigma factor
LAEAPACHAADHGDDRDLVYHLYLREIGQVKLLTREEEVALARRVQQGDAAAREHMIKANLRLVVKIARDYEGQGLPLLDLISEGNIGLMKAVERYDLTRGVKLSSYAAYWIKQGIRRALANLSKTIRLPVHVQEKLISIHRAALKLRRELGREPEDEELAQETGVSARRIRRYRQAALCPVSLEAPLDGDETNPVSETVADESAASPDLHIDDPVNLQMLAAALEELDERETMILRQRFGLDGEPERTLDQVSRQFGLTRERIRQIQNQALRKLRARLEDTPTVEVAA